MTVSIPMAVVGLTISLIGLAAAAGIAVLTRAEPGLSQLGKAVWHCTYIVDNRETTVILENRCPASLSM